MENSSTFRDVTRRGFITDVAVGATGALALSTILAGEARAMTDEPNVSAAEWDLTWIDRLTGKYRTVFDAPEVNDGMVFTNASVFLMGFKEVYNASDADMQAVLVLRHKGVVLAFDDAMWEKYGIGTELKIPNAERKNPWSGELATLRGRGATLLACNLAANRQAREIAKRVGEEPEKVRADIYANFAPGVILQPSGVFATIRAQQAGCAFMKSA